MTIAESSYAEFLATSQLLKQYPETRDRVAELLDQNPEEYAHQACPSSIDINVVVLSQEDNFLAFRRSSAVGTEKKLWTAGPNEAMKLPESPDLFGLAEHCLREELALEPADYDGHIVISWLGFNKYNLQAHAVAQVRSAISEDELRRRAARAKNNFEQDCLQWLPFNETAVAQFLADRSGPLADRKWLDQEVRLALYEAWRMQDLLSLGQTHRTVAAPSIQKPDSEIVTDPFGYVTLDQMAAIVNRSKRTLERLKTRRKNSLPNPDVEGGAGRPDEWHWSKVRNWLEQEFSKRLPERYPAHRH